MDVIKPSDLVPSLCPPVFATLHVPYGETCKVLQVLSQNMHHVHQVATVATVANYGTRSHALTVYRYTVAPSCGAVVTFRCSSIVTRCTVAPSYFIRLQVAPSVANHLRHTMRYMSPIVCRIYNSALYHNPVGCCR